MADVGKAWDLEVDRGPDWLFVRLHPNADEPAEVAERLWSIAQRHFTYRIVLELDELHILPSRLLGQLVVLHKRLLSRHGALRLCGLSASCAQALEFCRLNQALPTFEDREDAVHGRRRQRWDAAHRIGAGGEATLSQIA
ncbi:MAG: STAS domain-containing protein [Planctomycetota bacterium]